MCISNGIRVNGLCSKCKEVKYDTEFKALYPNWDKNGLQVRDITELQFMGERL